MLLSFRSLPSRDQKPDPVVPWFRKAGLGWHQSSLDNRLDHEVLLPVPKQVVDRFITSFYLAKNGIVESVHTIVPAPFRPREKESQKKQELILVADRTGNVRI